jgi:WD40 repeat protein
MTLEGHKHYIESIYQLEDGTILSGSYDDIHLWNLHGKCIRTISHAPGVASIVGLSNVLFAGASGNLTLCIWDSNNGEIVKTLKEGPNAERSRYRIIKVNEDTLAGISDKRIELWSISSGECVRIIVFHEK